MTAQSILEEIRPLGRDSYKRILFNHGVQEPCFGVKIEDLKKIQKRIRMDYRLALDLYDTGVYDAMYLAGLIADDARMTRKDLKHWLAGATHAPLLGWTIPSVAAGSPQGWALALEWIESKKESAAIAGWATAGAILGVKPDTELDLATLKQLLQRVEKTIHRAPDKLRYQMNSFVIAAGCHVKPLSGLALRTAEKIGPLKVDMGDTACQVPFAPDCIRKAEKRGTLGKKRQSAKC